MDLIISNCVINLAVDKDRCFKEMFRVLKKGGRLALSDMVLLKAIPSHFVNDLALWSACISGALMKEDYIKKLEEYGFSSISVEVVKKYSSDVLDAYKEFSDLTKEEKDDLISAISSSFISAKKPCCCNK